MAVGCKTSIKQNTATNQITPRLGNQGQREHQIFELLNRLDDAAGEDWQAFDAVNAELRKLCHRKFDALPRMFDTLTSPLCTKRPED